MELTNPKNEMIVLLRREDGSTVIPRGDTRIRKGDVLVMRKAEDISV